MRQSTTILAAILLLLPIRGYATIRTVTNTADSGAGSLRDTIAASAAGDTIRFSGMLLGTPRIVLTSGELVIGRDLTISANRRVIIDGNQNGRVFRILAGTVNLSGLTITNGLTRLFVSGGGILNVGSTVTLNSCSFLGNSSGDYGGGIQNDGTLTLNNCTFSANLAEFHGGGIRNDGTLTLNNCTFRGNLANWGGGVANDGTMSVNHCTFFGNTTRGVRGGGIVNNVSAMIQNTIIAGNDAAAPDVYGIIISQGFNLIGTTNMSSGWVASDLTGTTAAPLDPQLGPLQNNGGLTLTLAPLPGSAAIDAGMSGGLTTDQIGQLRPFDNFLRSNAPGGDGSDIGAFEVQGPVITTQPASQTAMAGQDVTFSVAASDLATMTFQWRKDGNNILGATGPSCTRVSVQLADAGDYSVVISDAYGGSVLSSSATLTVGFALNLTVNDPAGGTATAAPDQMRYLNDTPVVLTAVPSEGWGFVSWSGDASGSANPLNVTMNGNKTITASFVRLPALTIITNGPGRVLKTPDQRYYPLNSSVRLNAIPDPGWTFTDWSSDADGAVNPLDVTMSGDKQIMANFHGATLGIYIYGAGFVTRSPNQNEFATNSIVTLTATPIQGWVFAGWSGDASGTNSPLNVVMNRNKTINATFYGPPSVYLPPLQSPAVYLHSTVTFTPQFISGQSPFTYQWRRNGANLPGANGESLTLSNVRLSDSGAYSVTVSNAYGGTTSSDSVLTVVGLAPGDVDLSFNPTNTFLIRALAVQPDGKIVVGGEGGGGSGYVGRLNADGSVDSSFAGPALNGPVFSIAVQPDGKVLVGGPFSVQAGFSSRYGIVRLSPNGSVDGGFNAYPSNGGVINSIAIQSNGLVLIGGQFQTINNTPRNGIARLNGNGSLDNGFQNGMAGANGNVYSIAPQPDGKVLVGGAFSTINGTSANRIARLNGDGSVDNFQSDASFDYINSIALQSDGRILVGGFGQGLFGGGYGIVRLNSSGGSDFNFRGRVSANADVRCVALQPDGKVLVGGGFSVAGYINGSGMTRNGIARFNPDGSPDSFQDGLSGANGPVNAMVLQSDGMIVIAGAFGLVNGLPCPGLARLRGLAAAFLESPTVLDNGRFQATVTGEPGRLYAIQNSTNLLPGSWVNIYTNAAPYLFTATNFNLYRQSFYRALLLR